MTEYNVHNVGGPEFELRSEVDIIREKAGREGFMGLTAEEAQLLIDNGDLPETYEHAMEGYDAS